MNAEEKTDPAGSGDDGARALATVEATLDRFLATADVRRVYGEPVTRGDTVIIPAAEVASAFGVGLGSGSGRDAGGDGGAGAGGGGGGTTFARAVAVVVASGQGVRVEPVFDWTKLGLAALTAAGFAVAGALGRIRPEKALRRFQRGRS